MRYPEVRLEEPLFAATDLVLLSSEPYPFKPRHAALVRAAPGGSRAPIALIDAEMGLLVRQPRDPGARVSCPPRGTLPSFPFPSFAYHSLNQRCGGAGWTAPPKEANDMRNKLAIALGLTTCLLALAFHPAQGADKVKIGFVTTLTTGAGVIGRDMKDAVDLAVEHIGGKMAGLDVEILYEDDGFKPEIGKQKADKLVKSDDVDFVAGFIWSHVLLASRKSVLDAGKFLISSNAGPSQLAGKLCHENFFSTSWQNDQTPMAMGEVLNRKGVNKLYVMAPNYAAGRTWWPGWNAPSRARWSART